MHNQSIPIGPNNIHDSFLATQQDPFITPSQFGITVAIILVLVHRFRRYGTKDDTDTGREMYVILQMFHQLNYRKLCYTIVCLLVFCSIVLPVLVPLVLGCMIYRMYVHRIIKVLWTHFSFHKPYTNITFAGQVWQTIQRISGRKRHGLGT